MGFNNSFSEEVSMFPLFRRVKTGGHPVVEGCASSDNHPLLHRSVVRTQAILGRFGAIMGRSLACPVASDQPNE